MLQALERSTQLSWAYTYTHPDAHTYLSRCTKNSFWRTVKPFYSQQFLALISGKQQEQIVYYTTLPFGADMPVQVVDSKKTQSVVLHFSKQLTKDVSPVHLGLLLTEDQ